MIAEGVRDTDLGAYQRAARALLVSPLVTATHPDGDALRLVRRFGPTLARDLAALAGYRLELSATCARLVKRADRLDPTQAVQPRSRKRFDRRRHAYLCLVLGALGRVGSQVALSELADSLRRRAAEVPGLGFGPDEWRHRLAFVDVLVHLESLGVLAPIERSSVTYLKDPDAGEALYDVDRDAVHQLFVPPRVLQHVDTAGAFLADELTASRDTRRAASRQRLVRLLLELPVVYLDDLRPADRTYLQSQARALADDLSRLTGAQMERRAEGVALIDATGGFSDRRFPTGGTPAQVALLLAAAIADHVGSTGGDDLERATVPTAPDVVRELVGRLDRARPARAWAGDHLVRTAPDDAPATHAPIGSASPHGAEAGRAAPPDGAGPRGAVADVTGSPGDVDVREGAPDGPGSPDTRAVEDEDRPTRSLLPPGELDEEAWAAGPFLPDAWLAATVGQLVGRHGKAFAGDLRDDPAALLQAGTEVLVAFDLLRPVPGGAVARPAIARFRDLSLTTVPAAQLSLLDTGDRS